MKLIKKLVAWFEDLLWAVAIEDVFGDHEYYLDAEDKDGADDPSRCCYSGVKCYADDCGTCKERTDCLQRLERCKKCSKSTEAEDFQGGTELYCPLHGYPCDMIIQCLYIADNKGDE